MQNNPLQEDVNALFHVYDETKLTGLAQGARVVAAERSHETCKWKPCGDW